VGRPLAGRFPFLDGRIFGSFFFAMALLDDEFHDDAPEKAGHPPGPGLENPVLEDVPGELFQVRLQSFG